MAASDLRFPVGELVENPNPSAATQAEWRQTLADFPQQVRIVTQDLSAEQLSYRYRPNGWTIRQVVHHCADSHLNAFIRFKLALTEDSPTIKPYDETAWAELPDCDLPIANSLAILEGLHARWCALICQLSEADLQRVFLHPEHGKAFSLLLGIDNYQWHCRHHLAHIHQALRLQYLA